MSSPRNQASGEPEVPPDIPPEYADAYLAGFRRGLSGLEPGAATDHADAATGQPSGGQPSAGQPSAEQPVHHQEAVDPGEPDEPVQDAVPERDAEPEPEPEEGHEPQRRGTDLEWLFDRRESGPPGWSGATAPGPVADSTSELRADADPAAPTGATAVAGQGPRSPWPMLGAFVVVLLLLMLLAYLGGMAFSTIMNR